MEPRCHSTLMCILTCTDDVHMDACTLTREREMDMEKERDKERERGIGRGRESWSVIVCGCVSSLYPNLTIQQSFQDGTPLQHQKRFYPDPTACKELVSRNAFFAR